MMQLDWIHLTQIAQIEEIVEKSQLVPCLILKHSTSCSISSIAKARLEDDWDFGSEDLAPYYLDLIAHRDISAALTKKFGVHHESPQVILVKQGECVYDASHLDIEVEELQEVLENI
jgi:bacillithiol system protein YtxJ